MLTWSSRILWPLEEQKLEQWIVTIMGKLKGDYFKFSAFIHWTKKSHLRLQCDTLVKNLAENLAKGPKLDRWCFLRPARAELQHLKDLRTLGCAVREHGAVNILASHAVNPLNDLLVLMVCVSNMSPLALNQVLILVTCCCLVQYFQNVSNLKTNEMEGPTNCPWTVRWWFDGCTSHLDGLLALA